MGNTPLHVAAERGLIEVVEWLCKKGAAITAINVENQTPLHMAKAEGHHVVVAFLRDKSNSFGDRSHKNRVIEFRK